MSYIQKETGLFRKTSLAMFAGGFSTFAILYCLQPLMPEFSKEFDVSPAVASLSLSICTIAMAVTMLFVGTISDVKGRKFIMCCSLAGAAVITLLIAVSPGFEYVLLLRIVQGMILAGLPAIAMTYLSEEIDPVSLGYAMGLYISGNSIGGMGGRIVTGIVTDVANWRVALAVIGLISLISFVLFYYWLPSSQHFQKRRFRIRDLTSTLLEQCKDPRLLCLYGLGFVLMGSFVTLFNYIGYRLMAPPYELSQSLVGWIFLVYIMGTISSTWMGRLADRYGRYIVLSIAAGIILAGAVMTLAEQLWLVIFGISLFTFGFFGGHSIASSWIGLLASEHKAQSSALYLFCYYVGSSVSGTAGGVFYIYYGWKGVIGMIVCYMIAALIMSHALRKLGCPKNQTTPL